VTKATDKGNFVGIYEAPRAALYLSATTRRRISPRRLIRWVRLELASPYLSKVDSRDLLLEFEDLVTLRMVAILNQAGFSISHILRAEQYFRKMTGDPRPFATRPFWTWKHNIFAELEGQLVSGSKAGQQAFAFVREQLKTVDLEFNDQGVAALWVPHEDVTLKPTVQFGAPCVAGTRIPTRAIWSMIRGGDREDSVAKAYNLALDKVRHAMEWETRLEEAAA
jgi:uncharacterized protein (DUF433 family)